MRKPLMKDSFSKADLERFRQICIKRVEEIDPDRNATLALSGGTDSITILFAMLETGRKPECYTFYMDGIISQDLLSSRKLAEHFGLKLNEVCIPSDTDSIYNDVRDIIPHCEYIKKTIVQCVHPWKYIYGAMGENKKIINGIGGDEYYATQRAAQVRYGRGGDAIIINGRIYYGNDLKYSTANIIRYADQFDKINIDFYETKEIQDFLLEFKFKAINRPYPKYPSIAAFYDYYQKGSFYRDQTEHSYQINSRLKHCHNRLLTSKYNKGGYKDVIGIYNQIAKELGHGTKKR